MISFNLLTEKTRDELLEAIRESAPDADMVFASDNITLLLEDESDTEYAVTYAHGCLLVRIYDGEYSFMYPVELCEGADSTLAAMELRAYAVKEEIPLVYVDVRPEALGALLPNFRHVNIDSSDPENRFYTVRVMSELALIDEIPSYTGFFGISVGPFMPDDDEDYARLCMDRDTNEFWGYDYSADMPDPEASYFRESAEAEFYRGAALCLAVRDKGKLVGEATLYYFDLMGGCECAVRILPEFRRRGYAIGALKELKTMAKRMGLTSMSATVDINNSASMMLTDKFMPEIDRDDKIARFKIKL